VERLWCASPFHAEQRELKSLIALGTGKIGSIPIVLFGKQLFQLGSAVCQNIS
jgi:hypothetical protein